MSQPILSVEHLSKSFGKVVANRDLHLHVNPGEIVALLGENGAGKSTLVKQIFGLLTPDEGRIVVKGDDRPIKDPSDAIERGIGMAYVMNRLSDNLSLDMRAQRLVHHPRGVRRGAPSPTTTAIC